MELVELKRLVSRGEGDQLEFKRRVNFPEKILKEIVAFSNSKGGTILIGVNDNKELSGLKHPEDEAVVLEDAIEKFCRPVIEYDKETITLDEKKSILRYTFLPGKAKPYYLIESLNPYKQTPYVRWGDRSVRASRELLEIMQRNSENQGVHISYTEREKKLFDHINSNGSITLDEFQHVADISTKDASEILINQVLAGILEIVPGNGEDAFVLKNNAGDTSNSYNYRLI
jgi:predicted HTH transcriptional regulator